MLIESLDPKERDLTRRTKKIETIAENLFMALSRRKQHPTNLNIGGYYMFIGIEAVAH